MVEALDSSSWIVKKQAAAGATAIVTALKADLLPHAKRLAAKLLIAARGRVSPHNQHDSLLTPG